MTTFLSLVNDAMLEAGVDLNDLTPANFASANSRMYTRFKRWVQRAYKDIQIMRSEQQYRMGSANLIVSPRVLVSEGNAAPTNGDEFECQDTGATFTALGYTLLSGSWVSGDAEAYVDFEDLSDDFKFNELVDKTSGVADTGVFRIKGWGRYDLEQAVPGLFEADTNSFYIQTTGGSTDQDNTGDMDILPLIYVPWDKWERNYEGMYGVRGAPRFITTTLEGKYDLYPRPDQQYVLNFHYTKNPHELSEHDDEPSDLPEIYHDAIVWRTVMYYAAFDKKPSKYQDADSHWRRYVVMLEANQMPEVSFGQCVYDSAR